MGNFLGKLFGFNEEKENVSHSEKMGKTDMKQSCMNNEPPLNCEIVSTEEVQPVTHPHEEETQDKNTDEQEEDKRTQITKNIVETVLKKDYGKEVILSDFAIKDFTKPGDNYATFVTSIQCEATLNENKFNTSYVAKINNAWKIPGSQEMSVEFFLREGKFLTEIKTSLNRILSSLGEDNLYLPECLYESYERGKEILIMKDLREKNFKMFDRQLGMNTEHARMVVNGLARVHASGFIYKERNKEKTLLSIFPYLIDEWIINPVGKESIIKFFTGFMGNGVSLLENRKGYEQAREWLMKHEENMLDIFKDLLYSGSDQFTTICHGDIWNNNILFRYNAENRPVEVVLLDLQMCRASSIATDLHYFLNASMDGEERSRNIEELLHSYYATLEGIMKKAQIPVPFSFSEFKEEFARKQIYGLITALMVLPVVMKSVEETIEIHNITEENIDNMLSDDKVKNARMMDNNPSFKSRFLSAFDDCSKLGLFDNAYE